MIGPSVSSLTKALVENLLRDINKSLGGARKKKSCFCITDTVNGGIAYIDDLILGLQSGC